MRMSAWITLLISVAILIGIGFSNSQCIQHEKEALLELKSGLIDHHNILGSWDSKIDCCSWSRVICDNFTGHVLQLHLQGSYDGYTSNDFQVLGGNISTSLLELKHLKYLDLSTNYFYSYMPEFFGFMPSLRVLNLSRAPFVGEIPRSIGNLTSLVTLDLFFNDFEGPIPHELGNLSDLHYLSIGASNTYADSLDWVSTLSSLKFLDLSQVDLSAASDWTEALSKLPSLEQLHLSNSLLRFTQIPTLSNLSFPSLSVLDLSENYIHPSIPDHWFNGFTQLELLDISRSYVGGQIPSSIGNLTFLTTLDFSENNFAGPIPSFIGNLTSLDTLDLFLNKFVGQIPASFKNLCSLRWLDLSDNQPSQEINELLEILSYCASDKLEFLFLQDSSFSGYLSNVFNKFKSLIFLDISSNSIVGSLPISIGEMVSLKFLDLSFNKLNGSLPLSFGRLENLRKLHLSYNLLEGEVSEIHFKNLRNLRAFYSSENHLIWKVNSEWVPPFQLLKNLHLRSSQVGPQFPTWLRHLKHLRILDLTNSNLNCQLPAWFLNSSSSLSEAHLSHNQMYGIIPNLLIGLDFINLRSNYFKGPLPYIYYHHPAWIDFSHNLLSGSIHHFLCNVHDPRNISTTHVLILKGNRLNGEMPKDCWINWKSLSILELSDNNFSGNIPTSIGSLEYLDMLSLHNNNLTGDIPSSLRNCSNLVVLDLSENELRGEIPSWIWEHLIRLKILNIRGNEFHGSMTKELCNLPDLQILDFANNNLNGTIPTCIGNLTGMSTPTYGAVIIYTKYSFVDSYALIRKGQMVEYNNTLRFVQNLDLSNNNFFGEIPEGITNLSGLQSLNLSHNFFTREIPKEINGLQNMESLDLSHNFLFGGIPPSMSTMNFLSDLNLSYNNLSGQIPIGTQLQSMDPSSFTGNKLCGPPLTKDCKSKEATPPSNAQGREDRGDGTRLVDWFYFYVSLALGFVVGFWCFVGPLAFNVRWRNAYFNFLDILWDKIWVWYRVNIVRNLRNYGL